MSIRRSSVVVLALMVAVTTVACGQDASGDGQQSAEAGSAVAAAPGEPIPIGVVTWREGSAKTNGDHHVQGVQLAVDQINNGTVPDVFEVAVDEGGGILGGRQFAVETYNEGYSADVAVDSTRRAVSDGVAAIIGGSSAGTCVGVKDVAAEAGLPLVITGCGTEKITEEGYPGAIHIRSPVKPVQSDDNALSVAARWILDQGYEVVQGVGVDSDFVHTTDSEFTRVFEEEAPEGFQYNGMIYFPYDSDEARVEVTKAAATSPDLLYLGVYGEPVIVSAIRAAREAGYDGDILTNEMIWTQAELDLLGDLGEGVYGMGEWVYDDAVPESRAFRDAYVEAFDVEPHWYAQLGYTATLVVAQAMQNAGSTDADAVAEHMYDTNVRTPLGDTLTVDESGMRLMDEWIFYQARGGRMEIVERFPFSSE